jgi:hypothetical protein
MQTRSAEQSLGIMLVAPLAAAIRQVTASPDFTQEMANAFADARRPRSLQGRIKPEITR